jgi:hypothetical protein
MTSSYIDRLIGSYVELFNVVDQLKGLMEELARLVVRKEEELKSNPNTNPRDTQDIEPMSI